MNTEHVKSGVRWVIATFGAAFAGWAAAKGWMTTEQIMSILTGETFIGIVVAGVSLAWSMFTHTKANTVAVVAAMPEVARVVTNATPEGKALAKAVPNPTVIAEPAAKL